MTDYKYLEKFLRYKLKSAVAYSDFEDSIQEGLVQAWKDTETGEYDTKHIRNRALSWAQNYLFGTGNFHATGDQGRTREGITKGQGNANREKVKGFQEQYFELHGKKPTQAVMAQGLGLSVAQVGHAARTLKANSQIKPMYVQDPTTGRNRLDHKAIKHNSLYITGANGEEQLDSRIEAVYSCTWESEELGLDNFNEMISFLKDDQKAILTLTHVYGYNHREITDILGYNHQAQVQRRLLKAHQLLEIKMAGGQVLPNPSVKPAEKDRTHCPQEHEYTEKNTYRNNGRRICRICQRERNRAYRNKK